MRVANKVLGTCAGMIACALAGSPAWADMTVNVGGRIQVDGAVYDKDQVDLGSGTELRRVRFFVSGDVNEDWDYKVQVDFAGDEVSLKDVYLRRQVGASGKLIAGQFKVPQSLEELTSSKYITFMERGLPNGLEASRRIGVGYYFNKDIWHVGVAAYTPGEDVADSSGNEGVGASARLALGFRPSEKTLYHVGIYGSLEEPDNTTGGDAGEVRVRQRPESHKTSVRYVDTQDNFSVLGVAQTGDIIAKRQNEVGLEFAGVWSGFSAQAEWVQLTLDTANGDPTFSGWYGYVSYITGGGRRTYKNGAFGRTKAEKAWEFALRFSTIDLNDTDGNIQVFGGKEDNITLGINYYVNPYLRFMFNYINVDAEGGILGPGVSDKPNIYQARVSMDFK